MRNMLRIAIRRNALKKQRLQKCKTRADWKTGRETHQVSMTPQAWYNLKEICKTDGISYGQFFEELIQNFMRWYVKESRKRNLSNTLNRTIENQNPLFILSYPLYEQEIEYNLLKKYNLDTDEMPEISELPKKCKPISIEVEQASIGLLKAALCQTLGIVNPNIPNAIEQAICLYIKHLKNELTPEFMVNSFGKNRNKIEINEINAGKSGNS